MSFPKYALSREIEGGWFQRIPHHWSVRRLKFCFRLVQERAENRKFPVALENIESKTGRLVQSEADFSGEGIAFNAGDILFGKLRPYLAKVYLAREPGEAVGDFHVLRPSSDIDARFGQYLMLSGEFLDWVDGATYGSKMPRVNWDFFGGIRIPIPPIEEQTQIADFLDGETRKLDGLVTEQQRLLELLKEKVSALVLSSVESVGTMELRLRSAARVISRPVIQNENELYVPLGLFNRGRGLFHKPPRAKDEMGDSDFFWVEDGDLIISGQFAWEGAVALAGKDDSGCVVSHRYQVLRGIPGIALTEYLFALLLTRHGEFLLNENSRGAAGRNRPLNINSLLKEKIPIPDLQTQEQIAQAIRRRRDLMAEVVNQVQILMERRTALISAAVTGQIDVRRVVEKVSA